MAARLPLTPRQADVLTALRSALAATGVVPSLREIGATVRLSPAGVLFHIRALERKGYILGHGPYHNRALALADPSGRPVPAPPRLLEVPESWVTLRIDVGEVPAVPCGHPRTADNRWFVGGLELCRQCGRDTLADHLRTRGRR